MVTGMGDLGRWEFEVTAERVAAFRAATGAPPGDTVPPTFTVTASAAMIEHAVGAVLRLDGARTVHGEQSYDYFAPVRVGQRLSGSARILSDVLKQGRSGGGMRVVTIAVEYRHAETGVLVLRETTVVIEKQVQA